MIRSRVDVEDGFDSFVDIVTDGVERGLDAASAVVSTEIAQELNKVAGPSPSPPGGPPARQTGALGRHFSTLTPRQTKSGRFRRVIAVGRSVFYGTIHELGIGRFPKRPFMAPSFARVRPRLQRTFDSAMRRYIRGRVIQTVRRSV